MINKTIKVEYLINRVTGKVGLTCEDIAEPGQKPYMVDTSDRSATFTKFKNNGQVSKTEATKYDFVNRQAEKQLAKLLEIESQRGTDEKRAKELAQKINHYFEANKLNQVEIEWDELTQGAFDDSKTPGWITIKVKTSHSAWYQNGGALNMPSNYYTQVPAAVEKEARELQALRKKHQNDRSFDFWGTNYSKRIVREADHLNY